MSTSSLKNKLKEKIDGLNEDYLLEYLLGIIDVETSDEDYDIPDSHKKSIDIGLAQMNAGITLSNEEVIKKVQQWTGK